ncbi:recombinase family protein [Bosea sp. (in: a-proteobacteria)]|uniref:recombinase family protein n=1 Tax=Bosea sp. (in: a-proteobacteria) TaxID=1871050 RepID=UPI00356A2F49
MAGENSHPPGSLRHNHRRIRQPIILRKRRREPRRRAIEGEMQDKTKPKPTKAVLYCRISDKAQERRGSGLASQEATCREYARFHAYDIVEVFREVLTGGEQNRPIMDALLAYLRKHRAEGRVVIIDDISRFARDVPGHWYLREQLKQAGGVLESPRIEFGDDADAVFRENILASAAQHQRQKNAEQTKSRMRARILNGFYVFACPVGYEYRRVSGQGSVLMRSDPLASILTEALEGFASGRFASQVEVKRFLESHSEFPKEKASGEVHPQRVTDILTRPIYAGYVEAPLWNVSRRKGHHEALISLETFERIQQRLTEAAKAPYRKDLNADFVLRGAVACAECGGALTACWSKSSTGKLYPYMLCHTRGCVSARKSIPRDRIEEDFEALLKSLEPAPALFALVRAMFKNAWQQRATQAEAIIIALRRERDGIGGQLDKLMERIVETDSPTVIAAYERKIAELENRKLVLTEKIESGALPRHAFEDLFERAMAFLSSPWKLWSSGDFGTRRLVLRLAFAERIAYRRGEGFSNAKFALPFNILKEIDMKKKEMARSERFERPTLRFVV